MIVHFLEVGRHKVSWTSNFKNPSLEEIAIEAKKGGVLDAHSIEARLSVDGRTGIIVANCSHLVGLFTIKNNSSESTTRATP